MKLDVNAWVTFQEEAIIRWQEQPIALQQAGFLSLVEENHAFNYQLWQAEDRARREDLGFEFVYRAKREIDNYNQQRNNRMELIDSYLYQQLQPTTDLNIPVHSETPGMIIDRLSILALKAYYMTAQATRTDACAGHIATCSQKAQVIIQQRTQLIQCLTHLLQEVHLKTRTFIVYHQFKMYNDPQLNPQLYAFS